jgi:hypothetical protein
MGVMASGAIAGKKKKENKKKKETAPGSLATSHAGKSRGHRGQRRAARSRTYSSSGSEGETLG